MDMVIKTIKQLAPCTGQVNIFYLTDVQWSNSVCIEKAEYNPSKYKKQMGENAEKQIPDFRTISSVFYTVFN